MVYSHIGRSAHKHLSHVLLGEVIHKGGRGNSLTCARLNEKINERERERERE